MLSKSYQTSPLGELLIIADKQAIKGLWFVGQKYYAKGYNLEEIPEQVTPIFQLAINYLTEYFNGDLPKLALPPVKPEATPYQLRVLNLLQQIPYGQTMTYQQIADQFNQDFPHKTTSARAVGGAVGHNPISILIPCHRVIGSQQQLTGYAGGLDRKQALLTLERKYH